MIIHINSQEASIRALQFSRAKIWPLEFILKLKIKRNDCLLAEFKIKRNDWLLADTCPQADNHCAFVSASSQSLCFILSLRMNSSFITPKPGNS